MQHINLETFANGAFSAQVNRAIEEVTKNVQDPNTDATASRKITVTIGFKPNQEREADGGLWKNVTMNKIKEYLEFELSEELEKHNITVIA